MKSKISQSSPFVPAVDAGFASLQTPGTVHQNPATMEQIIIEDLYP